MTVTQFVTSESVAEEESGYLRFYKGLGPINKSVISFKWKSDNSGKPMRGS